MTLIAEEDFKFHGSQKSLSIYLRFVKIIFKTFDRLNNFFKTKFLFTQTQCTIHTGKFHTCYIYIIIFFSRIQYS